MMIVLWIVEFMEHHRFSKQYISVNISNGRRPKYIDKEK